MANPDSLDLPILVTIFFNIAVVWGGLWLLKRDIEKYDDTSHKSSGDESVDIDSGTDPTSVADDSEYLSDYDFYYHPDRDRDD